MHFNKKLAAMAFAISAAIASFSAQASPIEVKVNGTITPGACTPTLTGGGTIDYGKIDTSVVTQNAFAGLPERTVAFSINCDVPTRVAVRATDNRSSSVVTNILGAIDLPTSQSAINFGLGTVAEKNIGGYVMRMKQDSFTADGSAVKTVSSHNNGTSWINVTQGALYKGATELTSWSATAGGRPIAFAELSGNFSVQAVLNKGSDMDLTNEVELDGSATLELVYL